LLQYIAMVQNLQYILNCLDCPLSEAVLPLRFPQNIMMVSARNRGVTVKDYEVSTFLSK